MIFYSNNTYLKIWQIRIYVDIDKSDETIFGNFLKYLFFFDSLIHCKFNTTV